MFDFLRLFTKAARLWIRRDADQHAAALAYFTPFALTPLIIISISIVGLIYGADRVIAMLLRWGNAIDPGVTNLLYYSVENFGLITDHYYLPIFGLLFVSIMIFITLGSLVSGLHKMWSVEVTGWRSYVARLGRIAVFIVVLQAYLVTILMVADTFTAVALFTTWGGFVYVRFIIAFVLTMLLLTFAYGTLALRSPSFQARFVGAAVAGLMLLFSRELVTLHFTTAPVQSLFGAAGLLITLLVWVYVAASIILYGAAFAKVYEDERLTTK
ncbi:MAG: hypothetical protein RLZZ70_397 [Candidatus Parcubacteria bacterium]|jgi:membrane protein